MAKAAFNKNDTVFTTKLDFQFKGAASTVLLCGTQLYMALNLGKLRNQIRNIWEVQKCGAEKGGEGQVDRSCKKWRNMSWSEEGQE